MGRTEIKILSRLAHPCVVNLKEIVTSKASDYNRNKGATSHDRHTFD